MTPLFFRNLGTYKAEHIIIVSIDLVSSHNPLIWYLLKQFTAEFACMHCGSFEVCGCEPKVIDCVDVCLREVKGVPLLSQLVRMYWAP